MTIVPPSAPGKYNLASLQLDHSSACLYNSPQPKQLDAYPSAVERLNTSTTFGSAVENQRDSVRVGLP